MNINFLSIIWFKSLCIPLGIFWIYPFNIYTVPCFILSSGLIFFFGLRLVKAHLAIAFTEQLSVKVNAINHNLHEALVSATARNEPISLSDMLSIKENLHAIESTVVMNRETFATHHRSLEPILSVTMQDYSLLARQSGLHIHKSFLADHARNLIKVNPSVLNKALGILLSNAISVSPSGFKIIVSTKLTRTHYIITVTDFGGGMKASTLANLNAGKFSSFGRRVDEHNRIHYGLGLMTLTRLISSTNISVKAKCEGQTTHVSLYVARAAGGIGVGAECVNL